MSVTDHGAFDYGWRPLTPTSRSTIACLIRRYAVFDGTNRYSISIKKLRILPGSTPGFENRFQGSNRFVRLEAAVDVRSGLVGDQTAFDVLENEAL